MRWSSAPAGWARRWRCTWARAGVGRITIVDDDTVDLTNLQRQIAHTTCRASASRRPSRRGAAIARDQPRGAGATRSSQRADAALLDSLVPQADVVLDCSDNFATRHAVNAACVRAPQAAGRPARRSASTADLGLRHARCRRAVLRLRVPARRRPSRTSHCATMGVFAPLVGIVGSMQAAEALKLLAGIGTSLAGRLLMLDARADGSGTQIALQRAARAARSALRARAAGSAKLHAPTPSAAMDAKRNRPDRPQLPDRRAGRGRLPPTTARYAGPESAYRLAFADTDFLLRDELRPVRMQLELLKPEMVQQRTGHRVDDRHLRQRAHPAARRGRAAAATTRRPAATRCDRARAQNQRGDEPLLRRSARFAALVTDTLARATTRRSTSSPAAAPASWKPATAAPSRSAARASA